MEEITFEEFCKVEMRVGKVLNAESVPKSDKLIKMQVSFGEFERQILAGVGKEFGPDQLVNRALVFVVNLAPRKMMGLESHGMLMAAKDENGLHLLEGCDLTEPGHDVIPGTKVG